MDGVIVELKATCDRTGKTDTLSMTTQEAEVFGKNRQEKEAIAEQLKTELTSLPEDKSPDLIVAFRGKVVALAHINPKSDDALARLLHDVTRDSGLFPKPAVNKRKPAEPAVQEDTTTE